jgi:hypothetical protein
MNSIPSHFDKPVPFTKLKNIMLKKSLKAKAQQGK